MAKVKHNEGQPCEHTGCLNHLTHPCEGCGRIGGKGIIYELEQLDFPRTIEALQQEVKGWEQRYDELDAGHSRLFKAFCGLKQENEQLQAQVTRYREALKVANNYIPDTGQFCACGNCKICGATISYAGYEYCISCARKIVDEALSSTSAAYHNPADVEVLQKAREAIKHLSLCDCNYNCGDCPIDNKLCSIYADGTIIDDVLAAIDKIGGREDV